MHYNVRLDCGGRTAREVLADLGRAVGAGNGRRVVVHLERVREIHDSLPGFLRRVIQFFNERELKASIVDPTGYAEILYHAVGGSVHVEICRDESEVSRPKRVLVVEDTEDSLEFVRTLLEQAGHEVAGARTAREALDFLDREAFDLVLLDLVLPDMDGMSLARLLSGRKAPLVAMSAYLDRWSESDFEKAGFRHRLRKPFKVPELLEILRDRSPVRRGA